jgi:hypothetical protein
MGIFSPSERSKLVVANPELAELYDHYDEARVISIFFANRVPAPLQTDLYARRVIRRNEYDPDIVDRKSAARVEREDIFDRAGVKRILVMGQAALRGERHLYLEYK